MATKTTSLDAHLVNSGSESTSLDAILLPSVVKQRLTLGVNLKRAAPYQWHMFDFNSMTMFNGVPIASNEEGIFSLFDADNDNGADIDAFFELPTSDLGVPNAKQMRRALVSLEASGMMVLKAQTDEQDEKGFRLAPKTIGQKQHKSHDVGMRRDQHGSYWMFRIENRNGCDFSVDNILLTVYVLGMGR